MTPSPSPHSGPFFPPFLAITVAAIQLAIGFLALSFPETFDVPASGPSVVHLPQFALAFVAGGVLQAIAYVVAARSPGIIPAVLAGLGGLPLVGIMGGSWSGEGYWPAPLVGLVLAGGALVDVVRSGRPAAGRLAAAPLIGALGALTSLLVGIAMLIVPSALGLPESSWLPAVRIPLAAALLAVPAVHIVGWGAPRRWATAQALGALPLLVLAAGLAQAARWPGVVTYGLLAAAMLGEPALRRAVERRVAERRTEPRAIADYEMATEAAAWGFVLLIGLAASVEVLTEARKGLVLLTAAVSAFTLYWFHLGSVRGARLSRTVVGTAVYSVFVAILVSLTGGIRSPYFFVYSLPIIALAWTRAPQSVVVPLTVPLVALITETAVLVGAGGTVATVIMAFAAPRIGGLVLVAGVSYLLARRNLDEQRRTLAAHRQLQTVLASMDEGLLTVDAAGCITLANDAARVLLGTDPSGRAAQDVLGLRRLDGGAIEWADHPVCRAMAGHRVPWERVLSARSRDAAPLAIAATPLADDQQRQGAIVLLRDVRAEIEMERLRDDFFFIASHELRTPLTIMQGNLEIAREAAPGGPLRTAIDEALASVQRLTRIVNDYLDAARLEHGTLDVHVEDGHLPDLVRQAVYAVRPDAERKGLTVVYREPSGLPAVRMDPERTLQILLNLLGNSVRYTARGRIEVWHEVHGGIVETLVRDTGPGIPAEHHVRLFTRFGQVGRGLTRSSGGSGLGLYISRRLAEQMGGTVILARSAPGEGSTFALRLAAVGGGTR